MNNIIAIIKSVYPVSDQAIDLLVSNFKLHKFPKKHQIISSGKLDRDVYFIEKGITRSYCLIDGNEVTTWFSKEGDTTFGLLDLYRGEPGFEYVETLEETTAYSISCEKLNEICSTNLDLSNWFRIVHQECVLSLQLNRIDVLSLSAAQRHEKLLERYPDIYQRANLGHIASFLGITLPTLSKIRK